MNITLIKQLRADTGLSVKDCTKAAKETDSYDAAILYLRQRNKDVQAKRADRETNHGTTAVFVNGTRTTGTGATLIILGCETDFVSDNGDFKIHAREIARTLQLDPALDDIDEWVTGISAEFGENVKIVETKTFTAGVDEFIESYNHGNIAVVVSGKFKTDGHIAPGLLRTVAMHIAASSPLPRSLGAYDLKPSFIEQERSLIEGSDDVKNKPENIRDKIVAGKMNKVYKTHCLLEQEMLTAGDDTKQSVGKWAEANGIVITGFELVSLK